MLGRIFALALCCFLWCGCSERDETRHPLFQKGRKARSEGDGAAAADFFRKLLLRHPGAVRAHLELAGVYDELLNDPLLAAAHYRIYLELAPDDVDRETIRMWQSAAEKRFCDSRREADRPAPESASASSLPDPPASAETPAPATGPEMSAAPGNAVVESVSRNAPGEAAPALTPPQDSSELAGLRAENERLRAHLEECKKQLALLGAENRKLRTSAPAAGEGAAPRPASAPPETYTVVAGDTLSGISLKVYGSSRFYPEILRANPGVGERSLRPGKVLRIPPRPGSAPSAEPIENEVK